MNQTNRSRLSMISAMAIFGTLAPFVRNISVSSGELALYRAIMASGMLALVFLFANRPLNIRRIGREFFLLLLSGAFMGFNWILLFEAYKYTTVSVATLSYYFAPVIVTALCPVLFREKMSRKSLLCFCMSTLGLVLVIGVGTFEKGGTDGKGIAFGLGAAVLYASVILLNKFIRRVSGLERTFWQFLAAIVVLLPYVLFSSGMNLGDLALPGWICLLVVGLVHTGFAYCLYFSAFKDISGQEAAILSYIDPLVAVVVSVAVLGETITLGQILGGGLILGFTLWNELDT